MESEWVTVTVHWMEPELVTVKEIEMVIEWELAKEQV